jgi:D-beta-D-heptose 7-phosphate kinase/D-beta-D-heptose 1-phosphate adenosyltransferase
MRGMKILLIGENCKDVFIYGDCDRLNPEAPTPVFIPKETQSNYGMAGNVKNNIKSLGMECDFITNDEVCHKKRYVDSKSNYILLRVDEDVEYKPLTKTDLLNIGSYDLVIVSDYNKGLLTDEILNYIGESAKLSFVDSKREIGDWVKSFDCLKINNNEYNQNKKYIDNNFYEKTVITMGSDGCKINNTIIDGEVVDVSDVVGAGDTFLAALSLKYLENNDIYESMKFANHCSSKVVSQRGVALPF